MKKKLVAFAVTAAMLVTSAVPAFALTNWGGTTVDGNVVTVGSKDSVPSSEVAYTFAGNDTTTFETVVDFNQDLSQGNALNLTLNYVDIDGVNQSVVLQARDQGDHYAVFFEGEDETDFIENLNGVCTLEWTVSKDEVKVRVIEHASGEDYVVNTKEPKFDYVARSLAPAAVNLTSLTAKTTAGEIDIYKVYPEQLLSIDVCKKDAKGEYSIKVDQPSFGDELKITALNLSNDTVISSDDFSDYVYKIQWMRDGSSISGATDTTYTVNHDADRGTRITVKVTLKANSGIFKEYTWGNGTDRIAEFDRFAGANRYETAIAIAEAYKATKDGKKFDAVLVANGDTYVDALSATALADKVKAPILLVNENNEDYVADYILANLRNTNSTVYFIGGEGVVSKEFADKFYKYKRVRFAGDDRYDTNMMILRNLGIENADVMVCSAADYADALSASATGNPVFLVGDTLTDTQKDFLKNYKRNTEFVAIGGNAVVGNGVVEDVATYDKNHQVERLYGDNRYETNAKVVAKYFTGNDDVIVASGNDFPDALTSAAYAANMGYPVLLVNDYNYNRAANFIDDDTYLMVAGGEGVVSNELVQKIA